MLIQIPGAPYGVRVLPGIPFGSGPASATSRGWDMELTVDMLLPDPKPPHPVPAILYFHGGGWELGDKAVGMYPWLSPLVAAQGFVAVNVDYRLSWVAAHPAQIEDARAAVTWLKENAMVYGIAADRIGVWGHSAGGHIATMLGVDKSGIVQAVVAHAAVTDLRPTGRHDIDQDEVAGKLVGGRPSEHGKALHDLSPIAHVHEGMPPTLVVHGTDDEIVPFDSAELFVRRLREKNVDVTFHVIAGGHHDLRVETGPRQDTQADEALSRQAVEFFTKHLVG